MGRGVINLVVSRSVNASCLLFVIHELIDLDAYFSLGSRITRLFLLQEQRDLNKPRQVLDR